MLTGPTNGTIFCLLGDDGNHSYEDTCNFTCNTGYELTGSDTRTCQSDGSWSGSDDVCGRGAYNTAIFINTVHASSLIQYRYHPFYLPIAINCTTHPSEAILQRIYWNSVM